MAHFLMILILTSTLFLSSFSSQNTHHTIPIGSSITADQNSKPWLSPSGDFAFGFQQLPGNKTDLYVLSIWFAKLLDQTVAWFDRQLAPHGATLTLDAINGLVLLDHQGKKPLYYYTKNLAGRPAYASMTDAGNFVVWGNDSNTPLWESFMNPADTLLPTQSIAINGSSLVSRKSRADFSYGIFYAAMNAQGNFALSTKSVFTNSDFDAEYYNSNPISGDRLVLDGSSLSIHSLGGINGKSSVIIPGPNLLPSEFYFRAVLDFDGVFALYYHPRKINNNSEWVYVGSLPDHNICIDIGGDTGSGACGYNSVCSLENWRPVCSCPRGFTLVDPNNRYGGCKPEFSGNRCSQGGPEDYELVEIPDVDWPKNDYEQINPSTVGQCRDACMSDEFCGAAIFRSLSCWKKRLPLSNGKLDTGLGSVAFLKVRKGSVNQLD